MHKETADLKKRLYRSGIVVLVAGLCGAALIYLTAGEAPAGADGYRYVIVDGKSYPIPLRDTKMYVRDLQRFGGKAAVLFDEFNSWFAGLWQGRSLAFTVAWISVFLSLGIFLLAGHLPPDPASGIRGEDDRGEPM